MSNNISNDIASVSNVNLAVESGLVTEVMDDLSNLAGLNQAGLEDLATMLQAKLGNLQEVAGQIQQLVAMLQNGESVDMDELESLLEQFQSALAEIKQELKDKSIDPSLFNESQQQFFAEVNQLLDSLQQDLSNIQDQDAVKETGNQFTNSVMNAFVQTSEENFSVFGADATSDYEYGSAITGYQANTSLSTLIAQLGSENNGNILLLAFILFMALSEGNASIIKTDGKLVSRNKGATQFVNKAINAFLGLANNIPYKYTDENGKKQKVDDLYGLFRLAYATDADGKQNPQFADLRASLDDMLSLLQTVDSTALSQIEKDNWPDGDDASGDKKLFTTAVKGLFDDININIEHISDSLDKVPELPTGKSGNYKISEESGASTIVGQILTNCKSAVTEGGNISNELNAQIQADTTNWQQTMNGMFTFITYMQQITQAMWK